ncbi:hypothetical protein [Methanoculleus sp. UBA312]|uniref:hypothetical protein n=1 Tax=Methanoculleus sp. UBA312 TaxID=1915499 RepID=UPI0031BAB39E
MTDLVEVLVPVVVPLATLALGYVAARYGPAYHKAKQGFSKVVDLLEAVRDAWEDDEVTTEEFDRIMQETGELVDELRA